MLITNLFSIVIFIVSFQAFSNRTIFERFLFSPYKTLHLKQWYRFITNGAIHADWVHLLVNLFVFWQFGSLLEQYYNSYVGGLSGYTYISIIFLGGIIVGNIPSFLKHRNNPNYRGVGASGGVSSVLFAYILINPFSLLYLYFIIPLYSIVAGFLFLGYSYWASKKMHDNIDHMAHFWGAIWGVVSSIALYPTSIDIFMNKIMSLF